MDGLERGGGGGLSASFVGMGTGAADESAKNCRLLTFAATPVGYSERLSFILLPETLTFFDTRLRL